MDVLTGRELVAAASWRKVGSGLRYGRAVSGFVDGSFECRLISDGEGLLPAEVMFATAPEAERGGEPIAMPFGCLLVRAYEHPLEGHGGERTAGTVERTPDGLRFVPS